MFRLSKTSDCPMKLKSSVNGSRVRNTDTVPPNWRIVSHFATMMTLFHSRAREADDRYAKGHRLRHGLV